ncbi:MAG: BamA/TamA family outer membrane protein, partial [Paracoccaceae bacterium]|nr:BamA/TamA family outer membrane protein [Paracoccaceae bacterium]
LWGLESTVGTGIEYQSMTLRHTVGLSLFWETPIGPLRFNFMDVLKSEVHDSVESFELTVSSRF